eukprot:3468408-Rhodomonas_salina.1
MSGTDIATVTDLHRPMGAVCHIRARGSASLWTLSTLRFQGTIHATFLRACYAMSGTDICMQYAMSGTHMHPLFSSLLYQGASYMAGAMAGSSATERALGVPGMLLRACYAIPGTDLAFCSGTDTVWYCNAKRGTGIACIPLRSALHGTEIAYAGGGGEERGGREEGAGGEKREEGR